MMTFTKRILAILLSAALVFSFTACTSSSDDEPDQTEQVTENDEPETTEQEETDQEETEPEVTEPEVTEPVEEPEEVLELEFIPELYDDVVLTEENMAGYAPDSEGQALTYNEDGSMSAVSISSVRLTCRRK